MRHIFKTDSTVQIFRLGTTSNDKIEGDKKRKIVQSYTFSKDQYNHVYDGEKGMKAFYDKANSNCLDCPMRDFGKCYTHKFNQYVGFLSMLKSVIKEFGNFESLPVYDVTIKRQIIDISKNTYIRFGTYGEPSLHPFALIEAITDVCDNWTGYTHQWFMHPFLGAYFMASTHNEVMEAKAREMGYRSFMAVETPIDKFINCPASKEGGYKSTCSQCGLCSGTSGKGKKSIFILNH